MAEDEDVVAEAAKLPLTERIAHKAWKVREAAYGELSGKFSSAAEDSKLYVDFAPQLSKIVRDANAPAQLVGLQAVATYADSAPPPLVRRVAPEVGKAIVEKALSGRPANKQKAIEAVLMFVGADAGDIVCDVVANVGFSHRTPKVIATAVDAVQQAVVTYGPGAVSVKPITASLTKLFTHSNELVRKAAKALVVELHRWLGDAVRPLIKSAPEVSIKELESAFEANAGQPKPEPKKLTRAMEQRVRENPAGADDDDGAFPGGAGGGIVEDDDFDLTEEIELLPRIAKIKVEVEEGVTADWYAAMESKKWNVRKQALVMAVDAIGDARIKPDAFGEVFMRLRRVFAKDANVNVVAQAAKLVTAMAHGLRKNFAPNAAKALVADLTVRLKEKNKVVTDAVCSALDALHTRRCVLFHELGDEISAGANSKVPKVRTEICRWMGRCFQAGVAGADLQGAPLKTYAGILVAATEDSVSDVRDAAIAAMAALQVLVGERAVRPYLEKLDKIRADKIATVVKDLPTPGCVASAKASSAPARPSAQRSSAQTPRGPPKPAGAGGRSKPSSPSVKTSTGGRKPGAADAVPIPYVSDDESDINIAAEDAMAKATDLFSGFDESMWTAKLAKSRAETAKVILTALGEKQTPTDEEVETCLAILLAPPGLTDSNFVAFKPKFEILGCLAEKCTKPLPRKPVAALLEPSVERLGDIKCAMIASDILLTLTEATSPRFVFDVLSRVGRETTNARAKVAICKFATSFLKAFGSPAVSAEKVLDLAAALLVDPPPALRKEALALSAEAALRSPPESARKYLEARKIDEELLSAFDDAAAKVAGEPTAPTRKRRFGGESSVPAKPEPSAQPVSSPRRLSDQSRRRRTPTQDSHSGGSSPLPQTSRASASEKRVSTGSQGSAKHRESHGRSIAHLVGAESEIIRMLNSKSWGTRQEGLQALEKLISEREGSISGDVGTDLMQTLRARMGDSNRKLAMMAYTIIGSLGQAMGTEALQHVKIVIPYALGSGCVDIKPPVREAAMSCVDSWFQGLGLAPLVPYLAAPLASLNSAFRKEYLEWLVPRLNGAVGEFHAANHDLSHLVSPCLSCLQDRKVEVRQLAELLLQSVLASVGFVAFESKLSSLTKSARLQLEPVLSRLRDGAQADAGTSAPPRSTVRDRPRSLMLAPRTGPSRERAEPGTPRSGLRRARPASARVPATPASSVRAPGRLSGEEAQPTSAPPPVQAEPVLKAGQGRAARSEKVVAKKQVALAADPSLHGAFIDGLQIYLAESAEDVTPDLEECVSPPLFAKMSAPPNRFQLHIEAIDAIREYMQLDPDALVKCSDVLLRWAAIRIEDPKTPPTVQVRAGEFISGVCEVLLSSGFKLSDYEVAAILPVLVDKAGSNRTAVRDSMLASLLSVGDVVEDGRLVAYLLESALRSTNARARLEVLSSLPTIFDRLFTAGGELPAGVMTAIAEFAYGPDDAVGRAAAVCIDRVHQHIGEDVWQMIGELSDEHAELLETRFAQLAPTAPGAEDLLPAARAGSEPDFPSRGPSGDASVGLAIPPPAPAFPEANLRPEDFRLSVAPAPPSGVMAVIGDSLAAGTPVRRQRPGTAGSSMAEETPALPARRARPRAKFSFISSQQSSEVQSVIDQLDSDLREEQIQGLDMLFDDLARPDSALLHDRAADVMPLLSRGFRDCVERLEVGPAVAHDAVLLKRFLNALMMYVREPHVLRSIDQRNIEMILSDVLEGMLPDFMESVEDWDRVRRGVNLAVLKILETCDCNVLFTALLNLLLAELRLEREDDEYESPKCQLLVKSIAKVSKRGFEGVAIDALLRDLNKFLFSLRPSEEGPNPLTRDEEPLRLIRTMVDAIVHERGPSIYSSLDLVAGHEAKPLVEYIQSVVPRPDESTRRARAGDAHGYNGPQSETLASIFDRLIETGGDDASMLRLLSFVRHAPEVALEPYIQKCPPSLQNYIKSGLSAPSGGAETVSGGRAGSDGAPFGGNQAVRANAGPGLQSLDSGESAGQAFLKRLREIQVRYGLPEKSQEPDADGATAGSSNSADTPSSVRFKVATDRDELERAGRGAAVQVLEKENGSAVDQLSPADISEAREKAAGLRKRMAMIRDSSRDA